MKRFFVQLEELDIAGAQKKNVAECMETITVVHDSSSMVNIEYWIRLNETNTDVRMYTLRIYSYIVEVVVHGSICCTSG